MWVGWSRGCGIVEVGVQNGQFADFAVDVVEVAADHIERRCGEPLSLRHCGKIGYNVCVHADLLAAIGWELVLGTRRKLI